FPPGRRLAGCLVEQVHARAPDPDDGGGTAGDARLDRQLVAQAPAYLGSQVQSHTRRCAEPAPVGAREVALEDTWQVLWWDACPCVGDGDNAYRAVLTHGYGHLRPARRVLDGVGEQLPQDHLEPLGIGDGAYRTFVLHPGEDAGPDERPTQLVQHALHQRHEVGLRRRVVELEAL